MKIKSGNFVASVNGIAGDASKTPYDNSNSSLEGTNVQAAIDELEDKLENAVKIPVNPTDTSNLNIWIEG